MTHVPPFRSLAAEADFVAWYGSESSQHALEEAARSVGALTVICGHTHFAAFHEVGNIKAYSGNAVRGRPVLAGTFDPTTFSVTLL